MSEKSEKTIRETGNPTDASRERKARRALKRMRATLGGGFPFPQPNYKVLTVDFASTRPERRRQKLGRA